jgi:hypothetical protein
MLLNSYQLVTVSTPATVLLHATEHVAAVAVVHSIRPLQRVDVMWLSHASSALVYEPHPPTETPDSANLYTVDKILELRQCHRNKRYCFEHHWELEHHELLYKTISQATSSAS